MGTVHAVGNCELRGWRANHRRRDVGCDNVVHLALEYGYCVCCQDVGVTCADALQQEQVVKDTRCSEKRHRLHGV